jgi:sterol desaturase/sphingolipid hydroxylase (fatty acid hydroxylase superfamily)
MSWLVNNEPLIRLGVFFSVFAIMLLCEARFPKRDVLQNQPWRRRLTNISLSILNTAALRALPFISAVAAVNLAENNHFGLFNLSDVFANSPWFWLALIVSVLLLDLCIYFQHRVFHYIPWLWRLHRVHHSDEHFDTTTAIRFHPLEIMLSMLIKFIVVLMIGAPVEAVILFEIILNSGALFNHGNLALKAKTDAVLRLFIITPDLHRIHHSVHYHEMNRNFGFSFSVWDRIFGTYLAQPEDNHVDMVIGLKTLRGKETQHLAKLLSQPFKH